MVGVPGRSKGCNTCLKRKVKCDEGKPFCGNCTKSNRNCGGYVRKRAYVFSDNVALDKKAAAKLDQQHGTITLQGRWKSAAKSKTTVMTGTLSPKSASSTQALYGKQGCLPTKYTFETPAIVSVLKSCRISQLPSTSQQLHHIFMATYLPSGKWAIRDPKESVTGNWMVQLLGEPLRLPALQTSLAAYAAAQIGRQMDDTNLLHQSRDMYLQSIIQLRDAISNRETMMSDETLAACMAISVYELTEGSSWNTSSSTGPSITCAYGAHIRGALVLLEARGPDQNTTGLAHSLFLAIRRNIVLDVLMHRPDVFMNGPEWRDRPWSRFPKNRLDRCIDTIFRLPPIQRMWGEVPDEPDERLAFEKTSAVIAQVTEINAGLQELYNDLDESIPGPLYWPVLCGLKSKTDDPLLGQVFPISFQFPTFGAAYFLITCWGAMVISNKLLMHAYRKLASLPSCTADSRASCMKLAATHEETWRGAVRNMCQTTEAFLHPDGGQIGTLLALATLKSCLDGLRMEEGSSKTQRQEAWIEEMMAKTATNLNLPGTKAMWAIYDTPD